MGLKELALGVRRRLFGRPFTELTRDLSHPHATLFHDAHSLVLQALHSDVPWEVVRHADKHKEKIRYHLEKLGAVKILPEELERYLSKYRVLLSKDHRRYLNLKMKEVLGELGEYQRLMEEYERLTSKDAPEPVIKRVRQDLAIAYVKYLYRASKLAEALYDAALDAAERFKKAR